MIKDRLIIFDTTLRDGEQSPGASMTKDEKVRIARGLEKLGVDVIEAGFPMASEGDFAAVAAVASVINDSIVCGLARALDKDIELAAQALKPAAQSRIHTFIATSPIHMQKKLRMDPDQVLNRAIDAVKLARKYTDDVEFSPEDAGRSEIDFLCRLIEKVISAGATTINIPDTVGYNVPKQFGELVATLLNRVPNADKAIFSVHCHNDLGLAVANSLDAVMNGARQVECTINGLGERAGNAALEEIVMTVKTRSDLFTCSTRVDTTQIVPVSRLVASITGFPVQPNKAIVGANAFAHESGIHQDGILKFRQTYEIMRAEDVGWRANQLVLGKHSGRNALQARLNDLGIDIKNEEELNRIFKNFKRLADKKNEIFDEDLQAVVSESIDGANEELYKLRKLEVVTSIDSTPCANLVVDVEGIPKEVSAEGDGAVDAAFKAIKKAIANDAQLLLYSVNNITTGTDSQGEVTVRLAMDSRIVNGLGVDTDIIIASAKAYINALNKLHGKYQATHPQFVRAV